MEIKHLIALATDTTGAKEFINALQKAKATAKRFGIETSKSAQLTGLNVTRSFDKQGQQVKKFTATVLDGNQKIQASWRETAKATTFLGAGINNASKEMKKGSNVTNDFVRALKRVAVVVPVWFIFRNAMLGVFRTITDGLKHWEEFDRALQKSAQVIHGFEGTIEQAMGTLTDRVRRLSIETGQQMAKLTSAFYRFGTVGIGFEESMQGMEVSTRLATVLFGDADQTARVLAQAYRLLGDSIDESIPPQERMAVVGAQIFKLWQTNAFELNEFTGALQQFLPTANVFNFSLEESVALLATLQTAGLKGSRAGRLLRTSMNKLVSNLDQVANSLGIHVNPALDDTFSVLLRVLEAVKELTTAGGELPIEAIEAMGIFGGVRSREAGLALVALYDDLHKNLRDINTEQGKWNKLLIEQNTAYQRVLDSISKQLERMRNLRVLIGEAFVKGITGTEDFKEGLERMNVIMTNSIIGAEKLGQTLRWVWRGALISIGQYNFALARMNAETARTSQGLGQIGDALVGRLPLEEMEKLIDDIHEFRGVFSDVQFFNKAGVNRQQILESLYRVKWDLEDALEKDPIKLETEVDETGITDFRFKQGKILANISRALESKLNLMQQELTYIELQNQGYSQSEIAERKLIDLISEKVRLFNESDRVIAGEIDSLNEQEAITLALRGDYESLLGMFMNFLDAEKDVLEIEKLRQQITSKGQQEAISVTESLVRHELALLRLRGASTLEIAEAKIALEDRLGINQNMMGQLQSQLNLEKEITKEILGQNKLSSDTIKLWEIAQRYGVGIAREIGQVVTGMKEFDELSKRASVVFQKQFRGRFQQFQAREFFFGGRGAEIPIPERTPVDIQRIQQRVQEVRREYVSTSIPVDLKSTINVNIDGQKIKQSIINEFVKQLQNSNLIDRIINNKIAKF